MGLREQPGPQKWSAVLLSSFACPVETAAVSWCALLADAQIILKPLLCGLPFAVLTLFLTQVWKGSCVASSARNRAPGATPPSDSQLVCEPILAMVTIAGQLRTRQ